jgi:hypothetical protein
LELRLALGLLEVAEVFLIILIALVMKAAVLLEVFIGV